MKILLMTAYELDLAFIDDLKDQGYISGLIRKPFRLAHIIEHNDYTSEWNCRDASILLSYKFGQELLRHHHAISNAKSKGKLRDQSLQAMLTTMEE